MKRLIGVLAVLAVLLSIAPAFAGNEGQNGSVHHNVIAGGGNAKATAKQSQGQSQANVNVQEIAPAQAVSFEAPEIPVSTAYAPGLTSGPQTCLGSTSVGGQGPMVGVSFGTTWRDSDCVRRLNADALYRMGLHLGNASLIEAAVRVLAENEDVAAALAASGITVKPAALVPAAAHLDDTLPKIEIAPQS